MSDPRTADKAATSHHSGTVSPPSGSSTQSPPNILVIQADQLAAHTLGAYGDEAARSPHIDELAAEGAVFDRAYCNSPLCAPSRASMMAGRLPSQIGAYDNGSDFSSSVPTFAHYLRSAGYHTALIGRMHFIGPDQHHGFEQRLTTDVYPADLDMVPDWQLPLDQKLQWYHEAGSVFDAGVSKATVQQDFDDEVGFHTLRHLNDRRRANLAAQREGCAAQPFLVVTSFIHPHDPYEPPQRHWDMFEDVDIPGPEHSSPPSAEHDPHTHRLRQMSGFDQREPSTDDIRRARRAYYAAVSYIDEHVGQIRKRLADLDLAENTVIIVTSDHGDMLGEKGLWYKMSPYEQSSRVPLIVYGPPHLIPQGRYETPVSLVDLLPTLLELSGQPSGTALPEDLEGTSLLQTAREEQASQVSDQDRQVVIEYLAEGTYRPQLTLVQGRYKYTLCPGDPDLLFDLETDPDELTNVAEDPAYTGIRDLLRKELDSRYDLGQLGAEVLASQARRKLVAASLQKGSVRRWDFDPEPQQRYVRGDFWSALSYGSIPDPTR